MSQVPTGDGLTAVGGGVEALGIDDAAAVAVGVEVAAGTTGGVTTVAADGVAVGVAVRDGVLVAITEGAAGAVGSVITSVDVKGAAFPGSSPDWHALANSARAATAGIATRRNIRPSPT